MIKVIVEAKGEVIEKRVSVFGIVVWVKYRIPFHSPHGGLEYFD
jgi:hypothetical protein